MNRTVKINPASMMIEARMSQNFNFISSLLYLKPDYYAYYTDGNLIIIISEKFDVRAFFKKIVDCLKYQKIKG